MKNHVLFYVFVILETGLVINDTDLGAVAGRIRAIYKMKVRYFTATHLPHNQNSSIYCLTKLTFRIRITTTDSASRSTIRQMPTIKIYEKTGRRPRMTKVFGTLTSNLTRSKGLFPCTDFV